MSNAEGGWGPCSCLCDGWDGQAEGSREGGAAVPRLCFAAVECGHAASGVESFELSLWKVVEVFPSGTQCVAELPT